MGVKIAVVAVVLFVVSFTAAALEARFAMTSPDHAMTWLDGGE
jgi:hypothetical protein